MNLTQLIIAIILASIIIYYFHRKQKLEEVYAKKQFENLMNSLEEKAKLEGTFKVSYFENHGRKEEKTD